MASIRNTVVIALMQVGVIVTGVLAAGICHRVWMSRGWVMPSPAAMLYSYGFTGLLVPLAWATGTVVLQLRPGVSEDIKVLTFWMGVFFLIALAVFMAYADVTPWLVFLKSPGSGDDSGA